MNDRNEQRLAMLLQSVRLAEEDLERNLVRIRKIRRQLADQEGAAGGGRGVTL